MHNQDDIWDEFRWEEFMKEQDRKVDRYMELFYRFQDHPHRDELIAREMGWLWLLNSPAENAGRERDEDEEEREEEAWKSATGVEDPSEPEDFKHQTAYLVSKEFALRAYRFVDELAESVRQDSSVVDFLANAMIASAKIAGGTGMGDSVEELGGNIAYCKRGLAAANLAIAALHEMRERGIIGGASSVELLKDATEARNVIALHILDLREKFRRGIP